jgi:hypothetical protein
MTAQQYSCIVSGDDRGGGQGLWRQPPLPPLHAGVLPHLRQVRRLAHHRIAAAGVVGVQILDVLLERRLTDGEMQQGRRVLQCPLSD